MRPECSTPRSPVPILSQNNPVHVASFTPRSFMWYISFRFSNQTSICISILAHKGEGKFRPRTGHEGPERKQKSSSTLSLTSKLHPQERKKYPLHRILSGQQGTSERTGKISPPTGIRFPARPARSESPCILSYPGPLYSRPSHSPW